RVRLGAQIQRRECFLWVVSTAPLVRFHSIRWTTPGREGARGTCGALGSVGRACTTARRAAWTCTAPGGEGTVILGCTPRPIAACTWGASGRAAGGAALGWTPRPIAAWTCAARGRGGGTGDRDMAPCSTRAPGFVKEPEQTPLPHRTSKPWTAPPWP